MGAHFPHAYGLNTYCILSHAQVYLFAKKEISNFFIEMFYLKLPLPYYNKRITRVAKIKKNQENTAYHNVLIVQS